MIDTSMKENTNIIYKKLWIRKQVNKEQVPEIARLAIKRDSTEKKKVVR
jgi:hypothetical protein